MNISDWIKTASEQIARLDAELILLKSLGQDDRSYLVAHSDDILNNTEAIDTQVAQRAKGMPLAYILGYREFYGRRFFVTPDVLIPRPETEDIIDIAKSLNPASILDIGTGSGCIAVTLALELPDTTISATDISANALEIAKKNAAAHNAWVDFHHSNLLLDYHPRPDTLIIANLPYVNKNWQWLDHRSLDNEPALALYADQDGLALIYKLIDQYPNNAAGLILEADPSQHTAIIEYAKDNGLDLKKQQNYILFLA